MYIWLMRRSLPRCRPRLQVVSNPLGLFQHFVPAGLYTVRNNLVYLAISHLDAATFQLLYQLEILTTALFSTVILKRSPAPLQWLSLCLLCVGAGLVQTSSGTLPSAALHSPSSTDDGSDLPSRAGAGWWDDKTIGFVAVAIACCASSLASVFSELVLEHTTTSIWARELQFSFWGIILGLVSPILVPYSMVVLVESRHSPSEVTLHRAWSPPAPLHAIRHLPACLPACLPTYLPACLTACLLE